MKKYGFKFIISILLGSEKKIFLSSFKDLPQASYNGCG